MYGNFNISPKGVKRLIGNRYVDIEFLTTDCTSNNFSNTSSAICEGTFALQDGTIAKRYILDGAIVYDAGGGKIRVTGAIVQIENDAQVFG